MNPQSPSSSSSSEAERDAFREHYEHLDLHETADLWGRPMFFHSHVQTLWDGWEARAARATPPSLPIDFKQASELLEMFGGEAGMVTLSIAEGHSGRGLYAHSSGYPEDGAEFLGVADEEAVPGKQASEQGGWLPIATAPKHTEVLVWREDSGPFIAKLTTPDAVITPEEMERENLEFSDDFEEWFADAYGWQEGAEKPTHWMPLPVAPSPHPEEGALLLGGDERPLDLYDEIECDLPHLFGRASLEGHEAGQRLAEQVRAKMKLARAAAEGKA